MPLKNTKHMDRLITRLQSYPSLVVAFSGGVDSTFLLSAAQRVIPKIIAVTAQSSLHPAREIKTAVSLAKEIGVRHILIKSEEMQDADFLENSRERCYICKKHLFAHFREIAVCHDITNIAHGANLDDLNDFRPGLKAATEMEISAPLIDAGLNKATIRLLSKQMHLKTWDKPPMACLATRIPYGDPLTEKKLQMVESAEAVLFKAGFQCCRVRYHGMIAKIEVPVEDFNKITKTKIRLSIAGAFEQIGFKYTSLDLQGYFSGSMNK